MKHSLKITLVLLLLFLAAQLIGLFIVNRSIGNLPFGFERPDYNPNTSYVPIIIAILLGTGLVLLLAKFKAVKVWKFWFFLSVLFTLTIAFSTLMNQWIALALALILSLWKTLKGNVIVNNLSELFIYAGLAAVFVPVINVLSAIILLIIISVYDAWAVWTSKHMVTLAEFQTESKVFAGLNIVYHTEESNKNPIKSTKNISVKDSKDFLKSTSKIQPKTKIAIIGGGDVAFPLLFASVILKSTSSTGGMLNAIIVSIVTTLALGGLLLFSKKDRYYPAMPFITAGCLFGYLIVWLISL